MKHKLLSKREESIAEKIVGAINPVWKAQILSHLGLLVSDLVFLSTLMCLLLKAAYKGLYYNFSGFVP